MKKSLVILLAATLGLAACNTEKKGPGGLLYTIHHTDSKEKIKEGDIVKMHFIQKNDKDSVLVNTYDGEMAQVFPVQKKVYGGDINDVLTLFAEQDTLALIDFLEGKLNQIEFVKKRATILEKAQQKEKE